MHNQQTYISPMLRKIPLIVMIMMLSACASIERLAIPNKNLIDQHLTSTGSVDEIDHSKWDIFLKNNTAIDKKNIVRVNYSNISEYDHKELRSYIYDLSHTDTSQLSRDAQLAYWANLYNALTVNVIIENYPVESIRNIKDGFFDLGPWDNKRLIIKGKKISLHDIEHGIIRPLWNNDPEIHYILNCAAVGCPNLSRTAFTAQNIQDIMHQAAISYVNDNERGVIIDEQGGITLSKIYAWYLYDFGGSKTSVLNHIKQYAAPDLISALEKNQSINGYVYDWSLNDIKTYNLATTTH